MLPPELLGLAAVVAGGRRHHGDGPLVVVQLPVLRQRLEVGAQGQFLGARLHLVDLRQRRLIDPFGAGLVRHQGAQPVAQPQRGEAVVLVVVADGGQDPGGLGGVVFQRLAVPGVGDNGGAGVLHVPAAQVLSHVEGLELLDGVGALGDQQRMPHGVVEVHQQPVAQPLVDLVLVGHVAHRQVPQCALLVGGIVVDLHVRVGFPAVLDVGDEVGEGPAFLGAGVGPERPEDGFAGVDLDDAEQVLEPPGAAEGVLPERVALEVEEDVPGVGFGKAGDRLVAGELVGNAAGGPVGGGDADLHAGLLGKLEVGVAHPGVAVRQLVDGGDARLHQLLALGGAHAGDQQQVAVLGDLHGAVVAAPAGADARLAPGHRQVLAAVGGHQGLEAVPAVPEHRQQLVHPVHRARVVPEHQRGLRRHLDAGGQQLVAVGGELQQRGDAGMARQLGVPHRVGAGVLADQEVGETHEFAVEEGRLEDDVGPAPQGLKGFEVGLFQGGAVPADARAQYLDAAARVRVVCTEGFHQPVEHLVFVGVAEFRRALEHFVDGGLCRHAAAQPFIEFAQRGELAAGGCHEVAGGVDQVLVQEKHGAGAPSRLGFASNLAPARCRIGFMPKAPGTGKPPVRVRTGGFGNGGARRWPWPWRPAASRQPRWRPRWGRRTCGRGAQ